MFAVHKSTRVLLLAAILVSGLLLAPVIRAAEMSDHAESLKALPADATFYVAWLKNAEQCQRVQRSGAWRKLTTIPGIQLGWMQLQTWWELPPDENLATVKKWVESPQGQQAVALLREMVSEEIFVYGDRSCTTLLEIAMEMNSEITRASFRRLQETGDSDALDNEELAKEKLAELLRKHRAELRVPTLVKGFRIKNTRRASEVVDRLEVELRQALADSGVPPAFRDKLKREQADGRDLLTFTVTGDQLPWGEIEQALSDSPDLYALIRDIFADKQAVVAIGVVENFLVVSISESFDHLTGSLGAGALLANTPAFARLNQHADRQVTSLAYVSGEFLRAANSNEQSLEDLAVMGKGFLALAELDPLRKKAIEADIDGVKKDLLTYLPEPGTVATASFLTDRGYESYSYNWGTMPMNVDATQPLPLIGHLGKESLGWVIGRGKPSIAIYDRAVYWMRRGFEHFEVIAENQMEADDWQEYRQVREKVLPLLTRIDQANRDHLLPGMADGQTAIVFEAAAADDQWCDFMDPAAEPLPLPTLAVVCGVSDAEHVKQAATVYFHVAQEALRMAHEADPDEVPQITLSPPSENEVPTGKIYWYPLPDEWGASARIAPNAGLSRSVLVLSLLPELSEKLLAGSTPELDGPVADFDRPLAAASHFKIAGFIKVLKPWIDYGVQAAIESMDDDEAAGAVGLIGFVKPQVMQFLDVLQVIDSATNVTYRDGDAWVTHGELRIVDLKH